MSNTPDFSNKNFQIWLKYNELDFEELSDSEKAEKWNDFKKNHSKEDDLKVYQKQNDDENQNIVIREEQNHPAPVNENWIDKKRNSWQSWCEQEHNPPYIYDENKEFKTGLEFDVYKTQKDKEEGKKAASIHYESERDVTISTEKNNVPDYELFDKLTKEAKLDGVPGITFEGEMTPEFKVRLAVACLKNGLNIENGPEKIDANLLGKDVSDDMKAKIETYNNEQFYKKAKEEAKAYKANKENDGKPFNIEKDRDPKEVAMLFAAYQSEGIRVSGSYEALEGDKGYFPLENLDFMTKEEKQPLVERNKRQKSIATARKKLDKLRAGEELRVSDEERVLLQERLDAEKVREEKRGKLSAIEEDKDKTYDEKQTERQTVVEEYKPQLQGRAASRQPLIEAYQNKRRNNR